jgi:hypothetical protein
VIAGKLLTGKRALRARAAGSLAVDPALRVFDVIARMERKNEYGL